MPPEGTATRDNAPAPGSHARSGHDFAREPHPASESELPPATPTLPFVSLGAIFARDPAPAPSSIHRMPTTERYKCVLLFGAPGVGKGTQGKILGAIPGFFHLSTGDMFRTMDPLSEMGKVFREYSMKGELVPDTFTIELWRQYVASLRAKGLFKPFANLLVLDGVPRNLPQARLMDAHIEVLHVVHLDCDNDDEMIERLKKRALREKRQDDAKEDVIRRRLQVYRDETRPLLEYYPKQTVTMVQALGAPAQVFLGVLEILAPLQAQHFSNALG